MLGTPWRILAYANDRKCKQVVVLKDGVAAEQGDPTELIKQTAVLDI